MHWAGRERETGRYRNIRKLAVVLPSEFRRGTMLVLHILLIGALRQRKAGDDRRRGNAHGDAQELSRDDISALLLANGYWPDVKAERAERCINNPSRRRAAREKKKGKSGADARGRTELVIVGALKGCLFANSPMRYTCRIRRLRERAREAAAAAAVCSLSLSLCCERARHNASTARHAT